MALQHESAARSTGWLEHRLAHCSQVLEHRGTMESCPTHNQQQPGPFSEMMDFLKKIATGFTDVGHRVGGAVEEHGDVHHLLERKP